ncbi:MAG TPA: L-seryl-tRNA(Sec) selenium transferase, partial [Coriobacteriia bacterium]
MDTKSLLRALPKTDELLKRDDLAALASTLPRPVVTDAVRDAVEAVRARVLAGEDTLFDDDSIAEDAIDLARDRMRPSL